MSPAAADTIPVPSRQGSEIIHGATPAGEGRARHPRSRPERSRPREAVRLAEEGADIIGIDACADIPTIDYPMPTPDDLAETARLVEFTGRRAVTAQVDIRDRDGLAKALAAGVAELGRLDIVVANAGVVSYGRLWEITEEQFRTMVEVHLVGTWNTLTAVVPLLIEQGTGGSIIVTSSVAGLRGLPFLSHYAATKHGVTGIAKSLANELGEYGIRVNTVHPHGVDTGMSADQTMFGLLDAHPGLTPIFMGALPEPTATAADVAATVAFLASDDARFITGSQLRVDLGTLNR
ncbi:mycofactocin-coupled SDR family oxidoreductase [Frankia sp. AiPs1]|nr:mycofactocin-coupled SDR family oxidoreductase [Frankia sp. AiPs1]MCM3921797.1 mycofactocin-coupled SDR family oxidoreductase [Frankia sp. AiPs1]